MMNKYIIFLELQIYDIQKHKRTFKKKRWHIYDDNKISSASSGYTDTTKTNYYSMYSMTVEEKNEAGKSTLPVHFLKAPTRSVRDSPCK